MEVHDVFLLWSRGGGRLSTTRTAISLVELHVPSKREDCFIRPPVPAKKYVFGIGRVDGEVKLLLDPDKLINDAEPEEVIDDEDTEEEE